MFSFFGVDEELREYGSSFTLLEGEGSTWDYPKTYSLGIEGE